MDSLLVRGAPKKMSHHTETDGIREDTVSVPLTVTSRGWKAEKTSSGSTLDPDLVDINGQQKDIATCRFLTRRIPAPATNIMDGAVDESVDIELDISKKPIHYTQYNNIEEDKYYFQLKAAQAKKSVEFIELLTAMSPGNTTDVPKMTKLQATSRKLHTTGNRTSHGYNLRGKNSLTLNCIQYPGSNSNLLDLKAQFLKMRQQDMQLQQQIELKEAEVYAQFKESMSDSLKAQSVAKKRKESKDLRPFSVPKAVNNANRKMCLAILPTGKSHFDQQMQKSVSTELPAHMKKQFYDKMKTCIPKATGTKTVKMKIGEKSKLPEIKSHLNPPYLKDCSRITTNSVVVKKCVLDKIYPTSNKEYILIAQSYKKAKIPKVADSKINISHNSKFFPPLSQEQHKVEKQQKVKCKSKELKLPDIYAPTRDVLKSCHHGTRDKTRIIQFKHQVFLPNQSNQKCIHRSEPIKMIISSTNSH